MSQFNWPYSQLNIFNHNFNFNLYFSCLQKKSFYSPVCHPSRLWLFSFSFSLSYFLRFIIFSIFYNVTEVHPKIRTDILLLIYQWRAPQIAHISNQLYESIFTGDQNNSVQASLARSDDDQSISIGNSVNSSLNWSGVSAITANSGCGPSFNSTDQLIDDLNSTNEDTGNLSDFFNDDVVNEDDDVVYLGSFRSPNWDQSALFEITWIIFFFYFFKVIFF